mmetsp:Transcript_24209/g.77301  ORF Transcript_24209/g.77301 Transcript_24209/m.77301 type:complete len:265 (-) Transcript_24209:1211-2005(-)
MRRDNFTCVGASCAWRTRVQMLVRLGLAAILGLGRACGLCRRSGLVVVVVLHHFGLEEKDRPHRMLLSPLNDVRVLLQVLQILLSLHLKVVRVLGDGKHEEANEHIEKEECYVHEGVVIQVAVIVVEKINLVRVSVLVGIEGKPVIERELVDHVEDVIVVLVEVDQLYVFVARVVADCVVRSDPQDTVMEHRGVYDDLGSFLVRRVIVQDLVAQLHRFSDAVYVAQHGEAHQAHLVVPSILVHSSFRVEQDRVGRGRVKLESCV